MSQLLIQLLLILVTRQISVFSDQNISSAHSIAKLDVARHEKNSVATPYGPSSTLVQITNRATVGRNNLGISQKPSHYNGAYYNNYYNIKNDRTGNGEAVAVPPTSGILARDAHVDLSYGAPDEHHHDHDHDHDHGHGHGYEDHHHHSHAEPMPMPIPIPIPIMSYGSPSSSHGSSSYGSELEEDNEDDGKKGALGLFGLLGLAGLIPLIISKLMAFAPILLPLALLLLGPLLLPDLGSLLPLALLALPLIVLAILFLPVPTIVTTPLSLPAVASILSSGTIGRDGQSNNSSNKDSTIANLIYNAISDDDCIERISCELSRVAQKSYGLNSSGIKRFVAENNSTEYSPTSKWMLRILNGVKDMDNCNKFICHNSGNNFGKDVKPRKKIEKPL